jgi:hypothetical protein
MDVCYVCMYVLMPSSRASEGRRTDDKNAGGQNARRIYSLKRGGNPKRGSVDRMQGGRLNKRGGYLEWGGGEDEQRPSRV